MLLSLVFSQRADAGESFLQKETKGGVRKNRKKGEKMNKRFSKYFDHTLLKPEASEAAIRKLCAEAKQYDFYAVCVNSRHVALASRELAGSGVAVAAVVGFPLGACASAVKAYEARLAVADGAAEIDMVLAVGALKDQDLDYVLRDIQAVVSAAKEASASGAENADGRRPVVKVILETCLLTDEEIRTACTLAEQAGADFVKTSTGFSSGGAEARHVALMKQTVGGRLQVKASGGIRDLDTALRMIEAGADRIGASASVQILNEYKQK